MKRQSILDEIDVNLDHIEPKLKETILCLFNLIEEQAVEIKELREENQRLRDGLNRLKGEQGKPDIKPKNKNTDISSERDRKKRRKKNRRKQHKKKSDIKINREEVCKVDKSQLPPDAEFNLSSTLGG